VWFERNHEPAHPFDDHHVAVRGHQVDGALDGVPVQRLPRPLRGDGRGQWLGVSLRADQVQRVPSVGADGQELRILTDQPLPPPHASRRDRLEHRHPPPPPPEPVGDRPGHDGLTDTGVGAGDEQSGDGDGAEHELRYPGVPSMTVATEPKLLTIDEFMTLPDSTGFELVEGVLTERKPMGGLADYVAMQVRTD
jgi:hypothetical protein